MLFPLRPPPLTRERIRVAYLAAITVDVLQLVLGPIGWAGVDELVDVAAMAVMWRVLGFHPAFLPTFALELLPITDMLPTWTGCVALVIALRRRQHTSPPTPTDPGSFIDV